MPVGHRTRARSGPVAGRALRLAASAALLCALAACAGGHGSGTYPSSGNYAPPGPADDPWGPYIREAAGRFQVPETWVREVMRQESGGRQYLGGGLTTSSAGAMGLMQVMPATYDGLRQRYGLGGDPYDPHDNIMAGTGYLREMYDKYGSPGFLAAYNAGPRRVDDYLASGSPLPAETVNYVASIGPRIGAAPAARQARVQLVDAMQPIASPGDPGVGAPQVTASMEPIASPGDPGMPAPQSVSRMEPIASPGDPGIPPIVEAVARAPLGTPVAKLPVRPFAQSAAAVSRSPPPGFLRLPTMQTLAVARETGGSLPGAYGVQVGAYGSPAEARTAAETARGLAGIGAQTAIGPVPRPDGSVLFRARLVGLSPDQAAAACQRLQASGKPCFVVPPEGTS